MKNFISTNLMSNFKNKGITLIALVITIIVLLILAGISIQTIKNIQLFEKTKTAKEEDKKAEVIEYLNLKLLGEQTTSYDKEKTEIIENTRKEIKEQELKKYGKSIEIKSVETSNDEAYFYVIVDDVTYKVSLKGAEYIGKRNTNNIELAKGDIEFVYAPTVWTNGKVKVEIKANKSIDGYDLEYKTSDNNTWTKYIKELEVDKNQDIYARLSGVLGQTSVATGTVANIDRLKPKDFTPKVTATTNSITIEATTTDQEKTNDDGCSGIAGYRFSKDNGVNWTDWQTSGNYTFNNLIQNTTYEIKLEVKDKAENTNQVSLKQGTGTVPSSITIGYSTQDWTNKDVVVTATANVSGYTLQYNNGSGWETYPTSGITKTSNGTVDFRLWDGINASVISTATVANIDKTPPTINLTQTNTSSREYSKEIKAVITDDMSQVKVKKYAYLQQNASYFSSNGNNLGNSFVAKTEDNAAYTSVPQFVYTVYAKDNAGNESTKTITVQNLLVDNTINANNGLRTGNGATKNTSTGVITLPTGINAVQFGPYWNLPGGTYEITYTGYELPTTIDKYLSYAVSKGNYTLSLQSANANKVVYRVTIPNNNGNSEFTIYNGTSNVITINNIRIKQL